MKEQRLIEAIQGLIRHLDAADVLNRELRHIVQEWQTEPIRCEQSIQDELDAAKAECERLRSVLTQANDALNEVCAYWSCDCDLAHDDSPCVFCQCKTAHKATREALGKEGA